MKVLTNKIKIQLFIASVLGSFLIGFMIGDYRTDKIVNEKAKEVFLNAVSYSIASGMLKVNHDRVHEITGLPTQTNTTEEIEQQRLEALGDGSIETVELNDMSGNEEN
jgi:hypothetical protein